MPVLPEVGSRIVQPGRSRPVLLGRSTIAQRRPVLDRAGRVAVLELGPQPHVGRRREPRQPDQRRVADRVEQRVVAHRAPYAGQPPATAGRIVTLSPSLDRRLEAAEEADVLVVEVDVDEAAQRPRRRPAGRAARRGALEVGDQLGEGVAGALDGLLAAGVAAQDRRDADLDAITAGCSSSGRLASTAARQASAISQRRDDADLFLGDLAVHDPERAELRRVRLAGRDEHVVRVRLLGVARCRCATGRPRWRCASGRSTTGSSSRSSISR